MRCVNQQEVHVPIVPVRNMRSVSSLIHVLASLALLFTLSQQAGFVIDQSCNVFGKYQAAKDALKEALAMAQNVVDNWQDTSDRTLALFIAMIGATDWTNAAAVRKSALLAIIKGALSSATKQDKALRMQFRVH